MSKRMKLALLPLLLSTSFVSAQAQLSPAAFGFRFTRALIVAATDRDQDGLSGPVRRVKTETAKITVKNGKPVEGARAVLETTTYDQKGNRVDNAYFLEAGGSLTGKEVYKYDERGNIIEMTLRNEDGSLLSKEVYTYEFDAVGNWVKMTTAVAMIEGGRVTFEPSEVTYRTISYFLDESMMAKMSQTPAQTPAQVPSQLPSTQQQLANLNSQQASAVAQVPNKPTQAGASQQQQPANKPAANNAPTLLASLDKGGVPAPSVPVAIVNPGGATTGGPAVKVEGDAPAAAPVRSGPLKPISGGILNGRALSLPAPVYPDIAKRAHTTGMVEVEVVIDTNGRVISAKAVKGPALLQTAAEQAAKMAKFTPTLLTGQPVKISGVITYNFTLQ